MGVANFYVMNAFGNGEVGFAPYGDTSDKGLRTLSGGQISIQVDGYLAAEDNATPPIVIERSHAVGDISAVVREASCRGGYRAQGCGRTRTSITRCLFATEILSRSQPIL